MSRMKFFKITALAALLLLHTVGYAHADFLSGIRAYMDEDYDTALVEWAEAAKLGDAKAMAYIGYVYFGGLGGYRNDAKAIEWFEKAADLKDPDGTATLARMYAHGWGVQKDERKAFELISRVEDAEVFAAQMTASEIYELGIGTAIDLKKALHHARRIPAEENGMPILGAREDRIKTLEEKLAAQQAQKTDS